MTVLFYSIVPLVSVVSNKRLAKAAPVPCPMMVSLEISPPNEGRLCFAHRRAAAISLRAKFPPLTLALLPERVFKNPMTKNCT